VPLLLDAGTGLLPAAESLWRTGVTQIDIWLTHLHWDHVNGFFGCPFLYDPKGRVNIHSAMPGVARAVQQLFCSPYFPVEFEQLSGEVSFDALPYSGREVLPAYGLTLSWCSHPHPQGCTAYRIDDGENAAVFATDVELRLEHEALVDLIKTPYPAGLLVVDGFFTADELPAHPGWGHSTWQEAARLRERTGAGTVVMTHHHPQHSDEQIDELANSSPDAFLWACEGDVFTLEGNQLEVH
jgi:phosphoribosyl 1,2-cyclic phosphodiesterase